MEKIVLASGSPRRRELLSLLGLSFEVVKSDASEEMDFDGMRPEEIVKELSSRKAHEVAGRMPGRLILGADTIVWKDGRVLGKPKNREEAAQMLRLLQGDVHKVFTGVTLLDAASGETCIFAEETAVHVLPMTEKEISWYLDTGDAFDKAGSYGIQGPFARFVSGIEGDYQNVVGLPVSALYRHIMLFRPDIIS